MYLISQTQQRLGLLIILDQQSVFLDGVACPGFGAHGRGGPVVPFSEEFHSVCPGALATLSSGAFYCVGSHHRLKGIICAVI